MEGRSVGMPMHVRRPDEYSLKAAMREYAPVQ